MTRSLRSLTASGLIWAPPGCGAAGFLRPADLVRGQPNARSFAPRSPGPWLRAPGAPISTIYEPSRTRPLPGAVANGCQLPAEASCSNCPRESRVCPLYSPAPSSQQPASTNQRASPPGSQQSSEDPHQPASTGTTQLPIAALGPYEHPSTHPASRFRPTRKFVTRSPSVSNTIAFTASPGDVTTR